jgi:hypothetical protein
VNSAEESGVARVFMMLLPSAESTMKKQKLKNTSKNNEENRSSILQPAIKEMDEDNDDGEADFEEENDRNDSLPSNTSRQRKGGDSTSRLVNFTEKAFRPKSPGKSLSNSNGSIKCIEQALKFETATKDSTNKVTGIGVQSYRAC